jgi:hypothetical protein
MAILLVTYDLRQPGRNYQPVHDYLKQFTYCKGLESVWLLDTTVPPSTIRDQINKVIDRSDVTFVGRITQEWSAFGYFCAEWLNKPERNW